jgi:peptide/nickel transport system ATP-binding protein
VTDPLVSAEGLVKRYPTEESFLARLLGRRRWVRAVDGVDLRIRPGETLALVGESGCGKSTLGRALVHLEEPTAGTVRHRGDDLSALSAADLRDRRRDLQYVFQNPTASLDPRLTVGDAVREALDVHDIGPVGERDRRVVSLLETVGLRPSHASRYPRELSGGQRQRVGIARALAVDPEFVVCDEPVSALDVSVQAGVLNLLSDLQDEFGLTYLLVAHDLSVVGHLADRVAVMYLGELVEVGSVEDVFSPPYHPYTYSLLSAVPEPDPRWEGDRVVLDGAVPSATDPPDGCKFHTRCPIAQADCGEWDAHPDLEAVDGDAAHAIACPYHDRLDAELAADR